MASYSLNKVAFAAKDESDSDDSSIDSASIYSQDSYCTVDAASIYSQASFEILSEEESEASEFYAEQSGLFSSDENLSLESHECCMQTLDSLFSCALPRIDDSCEDIIVIAPWDL